MLPFAPSLALPRLQTMSKPIKQKDPGAQRKKGEQISNTIVSPDFQNTLSLHLVGISFISSPAYNHSYYQLVSVSSSFTMHVDFSPNSFYMQNPVITNSTKHSKILTNIHITVQFTNFSPIYLYFYSSFKNPYFLFFTLPVCCQIDCF